MLPLWNVGIWFEIAISKHRHSICYLYGTFRNTLRFDLWPCMIFMDSTRWTNILLWRIPAAILNFEHNNYNHNYNHIISLFILSFNTHNIFRRSPGECTFYTRCVFNNLLYNHLESNVLIIKGWYENIDIVWLIISSKCYKNTRWPFRIMVQFIGEN